MEVNFKSKREIKETKERAEENIKTNTSISRNKGIKNACDWMLNNYGRRNATVRQLKIVDGIVSVFYLLAFLLRIPLVKDYLIRKSQYWDGFRGTIIAHSNLHQSNGIIFLLEKDSMNTVDFFYLTTDDLDDEQIIFIYPRPLKKLKNTIDKNIIKLKFRS